MDFHPPSAAGAVRTSAGASLSRYGGETPLHNNPIIREHDTIRDNFRRDGRTAPLIGGKRVHPTLLQVIPNSRYHKITPEMWENMQLMMETRNLWGYDLTPESAPFYPGQPLYRHAQPKRRINQAVGTTAKPAYPIEATL